MPVMVPPSSPAGVLRYQLVDPNGVVRDLSRDFSPNLFVKTGSQGLGGVTFDIADDKRPFNAGKLIRHINTDERKITLPIVVHEDSVGDLSLAAETLFDWFHTGDEQSRSPVYYRVIRPDGTIRQVKAYYTRGLEGDTTNGGPHWAEYTVELYCPDPYPTAAADIIINKTLAQSASFSIMNLGKLEAYPIWYVTGPFANILIRNDTTNESIFTSSLTVLTGDWVIFDTRPSDLRQSFSVYDSSGISKMSTVVPSSKFWTLRPGLNNILITYGALTNSNTTVQCTYLERYRSLFR